jgi:hypothetical protein
MFLLQAAAFAAAAIGAQGASRAAADANYEASVTGGVYRADDLRRGEQLLVDARLLMEEDDVLLPSLRLTAIRQTPADVAAELIHRELLLVEQPLWLWAATAGSEVHWEHVPERDARLFEHLISAQRREAYLLSIARTLDAEALSRAANDGEEAVVAACQAHLRRQDREDLARAVAQVSTVSGGLGYDVSSPDTGGSRHRIGVKIVTDVVTTVSFFVTQNEATQAAEDPMWSLVVVAADQGNRILGWCTGAAFLDRLPINAAEEHVRWWSARVTVNVAALRPGLPIGAADSL